MYQALYRRYRPQTFDDVVGQQSVTETLKTQLSTGRISHAYLFTGTRGTGKTSCAKILAKAVNCENPQSGNPCNRCAACNSIDSGSCMDVLEIDAASNNGVDNVRALRDDAVYTPSEVKRRVYIIDEVHMLSTAAFNALLKIIEEPPEHLIFILATTELHKVPATILSRCQRYSFRRLRQEDIAGRINFAAYQEGIDIEPEAVNLLARLADGALRDGLSLLDQCASATAGALSAEGIYAALGLAGDRKTAALFEAVAAHDTATALSLFDTLYAGGKDVPAMLDELCSLSRDLLILKTAPQCAASMLSGVCTDQEITALSGKFSPGELLRVTNILQRTASGLSKSANSRLDAELCLMELCSPALQLDAQGLGARLSRVEEQLKSGVVAVQTPSQPKSRDDAPWDEDRPPLPDDSDAPPSQETPVQQKSAQKPQAGSVPLGFWTDLTAGIEGKVPASTKSFLMQIQPELQGDTLLLQVDNEFVKNMVSNVQVLEAIKEQAKSLLGKPVQVKPVIQGAAVGGGKDPLEDILAFGQQHSEIFEIK